MDTDNLHSDSLYTIIRIPAFTEIFGKLLSTFCNDNLRDPTDDEAVNLIIQTGKIYNDRKRTIAKDQ